MKLSYISEKIITEISAKPEPRREMKTAIQTQQRLKVRMFSVWVHTEEQSVLLRRSDFSVTLTVLIVRRSESLSQLHSSETGWLEWSGILTEQSLWHQHEETGGWHVTQGRGNDGNNPWHSAWAWQNLTTNAFLAKILNNSNSSGQKNSQNS